MPIYDYKCECGLVKSVNKPLCQYKSDEFCECGNQMKKVITAPTITGMNRLGQSGEIDKGGKIQ